jgi:hypothetical protein
MIPTNRFFKEKLSGPKGKSFRSLGGNTVFHVYKVGPEYFLLTKNKAGELYRIDKKNYRKTYARYLQLKKIGNESVSSEYGTRWKACPNIVICPFLAAIK